MLHRSTELLTSTITLEGQDDDLDQVMAMEMMGTAGNKWGVMRIQMYVILS